MKLSSFLFVGSMGLNAALVAVVLSGRSSASDPVATPVAQAVGIATAKADTAVPAASWTKLQDDDLARERDRLRAEGFPPSAIRAILAAQIRAGFADRRKAIDEAQANTPFWKNPGVLDPKLREEMMALSKLEQKALKDLLGSDLENGPAATFRRQLPNVAPEKIEQLAAVRERYDEQRMDFFMRGVTTAADREKLTALETAMHTEFGTVLSPAELEDYDLRTSNTANNLRNNLIAFDASEQEFRALYQLQKPFDDQNRNLVLPNTPEAQRARSDAQKLLQEQIAAALGPTRYAEYQRASDYNYRTTTQLVTRLELPPDTANQLYAVQKDIQARTQSIYSGRELSPEQRAQLAALQTEALSRVTPLLGSKPTSVEAYKQFGGSWLRDLAPPPPAPTATAAKK